MVTFNINIQRNASAESKLEALRNAGINVDNLFSMKGVTGEETIGRLENGQLSIVPDDDPIFNAIMGGGTIPNSKLFRRWVMAQVFHMLATGDFTQALRHKGYRYQWEMLLEELKTQVKLSANGDMENFRPRHAYFNCFVVYNVAAHYMGLLERHIKALPVRHCKGVPYIKLKGKNIFVEDVETKVVQPLRKTLRSISASSDMPTYLYEATLAFYTQAKKTWMPDCSDISTAFIDSYKGVGAYFTMKNLILFHGARFYNDEGEPLTQKESMTLLKEKMLEYSISEGWRLFGMMKKLIADNGINIEKKIAEWRKV